MRSRNLSTTTKKNYLAHSYSGKARHILMMNGIFLTFLRFGRYKVCRSTYICVGRVCMYTHTCMSPCSQQVCISKKGYAFSKTPPSQKLFFTIIICACIALNNLTVDGRFKCAILITCYPRQIKSLYVKSTQHWIIYKTSIY